MKKIIISFILVFVFLLQTNAVAVEGGDRDAIYCSPDVYTHCEPIDSPDVVEPLPWTLPPPVDSPDYIGPIDSPDYDEPTPTPTPKPTPTPTPTVEQKAYVYINYHDKAWRKIYASTTYEWKNWELVNLSQYKKDLVTFKFVWYEPTSWQITLVWWRYLNATLIYEKDYIETKDSSVYPKPTTSTTWTTTTVQPQIQIQTQVQTQAQVYTQEQIQAVKTWVDRFFAKRFISWDTKQKVITALIPALTQIIENEKDAWKKELYNLLLAALKTY